MPAQTSYSLYTRDEVVGALYGLSYTNSIRHSYANTAADGSAGAGVGFGLAVQRLILASNPQARIAGLGNAGTPDAEGDNLELVDGISIRSINRTMNTLPGTGAISYDGFEQMAVLQDGYIHVLVTAGSAVRGVNAFVDAATGELHGAAIAGTTIQASNIVWERANSVGEIGLARITPIAV